MSKQDVATAKFKDTIALLKTDTLIDTVKTLNLSTDPLAMEVCLEVANELQRRLEQGFANLMKDLEQELIEATK